MDKKENYGVKYYSVIQACYKYFNDKLFEGKLPIPLITFGRYIPQVAGFYGVKKWYAKDGKAVISELGINVNSIREDIVKFCKVMIHEQIHVWQDVNNNLDEAKPGFHNIHFVKKAEALGFTCKDAKTGKKQGFLVDTILQENGISAKVIADLPKNFILPFMPIEAYIDPSNPSGEGQGQGGQGEQGQGSGSGSGQDLPAKDKLPEDKSRSSGQKVVETRSGQRVKFTCARCGLNAWSKGSARLMCIEDAEEMVAQKVQPK